MIIVTGATGFIGRRLVRRLALSHDPRDIVCLVRDRDSSDAELSGRAVLDSLGVPCLPVDLLTGAGLDRVPRGATAVFHLASDIDTARRDHRIDDEGTARLLDALRPDATTRLIYTSSLAVSDHRLDIRYPARSDSPLRRPFSEYGYAKLRAEQLLKARSAREGFSVALVRLCSIHGAGVRPGGVFGRVVEMSARGALTSRLNFPGVLTVMYVDDAVEVLALMENRSIPPGTTETFMPATETISMQELFAETSARLGRSYRAIRLPAWFWRSCWGVGQGILSLRRFLPHAVNNKVWQLSLTVSSCFLVDVAETRAQFPGLTLRALRGAQGALPEMFAGLATHRPRPALSDAG